MPAKRFGLYDLLAPQFLLGFTFPDEIHQYLSKIGIDELRSSSDEAGIVYCGQCSLAGDAGAEPTREHKYPGGGVWRWQEITLDFRLTIPRAGSSLIDGVAKNVNDLKDLFGDFGAPGDAPSEYPGFAFRLELMLGAPAFHLGQSWQPAEVGPDFRVVPTKPGDVKIVVPKLVFEYTQGPDFTTSPSFQVKSWGNSGFDAPSDLAEGEVVTMDPPFAIHENGRVAIGIDEVVVDFSENSTSTEILEHFGTDESFEGIYVKSLRVYYSDKSKDFALNFSVNDVLISFSGWVSLEAEVDVLGPVTDFSVKLFLFDGARTREVVQCGGLQSANNGVIQVQVIGGVPPYKYSVKLDADELWKDDQQQAPISADPQNPRAPKTGRMHVEVTDSDNQPKKFTYDSDLRITDSKKAGPADGTPGDTPASTSLKPATLKPVQGALPADGYDLVKLPNELGTTVLLRVLGPSPSMTVDGTNAELDKDQLVMVDVDDKKPRQIAVHYDATQAQKSKPYVVHFDFENPHPDKFGDIPAAALDRYVDDHTELADPDIQFHYTGGSQGLVDWVKNQSGNSQNLEVEAYASWEKLDKSSYNFQLSKRRQIVATTIIERLTTGHVTTADHHGDTDAEAAKRPYDPEDRVAKVTYPIAPRGAVDIIATLSRPAPDIGTEKPKQAAPPAPPVNPKPPVFRRLSLRLRLERNVPVLVEVSGELDFETELEKKLRAKDHSQDKDKLGLKSSDANKDDGVVDFKITVTWDTSTRTLTETLSLYAGQDDKNGLLHMDNPRQPNDPASTENRLKDIFGALLVFAPVINAAAGSHDPKSAGDWVELAVDIAVPGIIGALDIFRTTSVILYGGEARFRENIPAGADSTKFTDAALLFDYEVDFNIFLKIGPFDIQTSQPAKVRYKAAGFALHFDGGVKYQPVFDTSKGYSLELSDPGLFKIPQPLGDILKIFEVRLARVNPLTLEFDLGLKVDLGVVTVDRFQIKWPLHPKVEVPTIIPTGVKVDVSSVIVGEGHVKLVEGGFEGTLDVSIVPVKVRIAASLGVRNVADPKNQARKATAVYAGLIVEFPSPIVLACSGLGIFGFSGLFAMHYKRLEDGRKDGDAVSPALYWLQKAKGDPAKLANENGDLWGPEIDRWSFGIGIILGSVDGGFVLNLRGMFVLELPGPRILIFIKIQFVEKLPSLGDKSLIIGILGVVDLDFLNHQITIGVIVDLEIKDIVRLTIPIEIFFKLDDSSNWHVFIGTIQTKASALILNIVRAGGYFMFAGDKISGFPTENGPITLPGIAIAMGLEASIAFGYESANLYLKVAVGADMGVSFSPLFIAGSMHMDGELHLLIVSIEAHGIATIQHPPTKVHAKICGKVDLFLFSIEGCVEVSVGGGDPVLPAPPLVRGLYLQSHSPALAAGQGTDRPIDASLGDAVPLGQNAPTPTMFGNLLNGVSTAVGANFLEDASKTMTPDQYAGRWIKTLDATFYRINSNTATRMNLDAGGAAPVAGAYTVFAPVPLDVVPVIQFQASPLASATKTFTAPLVASPGLTTNGWVDVGGGRKVRYTLKKISISPPPPGHTEPPATWRRDVPPGPQGANTNVDLAVFSRVPTTAPRALERSTDLDTLVTTCWGGLCAPVAPPACVLWTFCRQPLGYSSHDWKLLGIAQPDPPGTVRTAPPPRVLIVEERHPSSTEAAANAVRMDSSQAFDIAAKIIGSNTAPRAVPRTAIAEHLLSSECIRALQFPYRTGNGQFTVTAEGAPPAPSEAWIIFDTGACTGATFFIAVSPLVQPTVVVRELDADGKVLRERKLSKFKHTTITGVDIGLPADWIAAASPWSREIRPVAEFLAGVQFSSLHRLLFRMDSMPACRKVKIAVTANLAVPPPTLLVAAIVVCSQDEVDRSAQALEVQQGQIQTVQGYLNGGSDVPLLAPGTTYDLQLLYAADSSKDGGNTFTTEPDATQSFRFRTDDREPARLDPWVLGTTPDHEEKFHFYEDTVQVVFNDLSVIQLFAAYGKKLQAKLRTADGVPNPTDDITKLAPVIGLMDTPFRDALKKLVDEGLLPCAGQIQSTVHGSYSSPVPLRPSMAYTLDIEVDPPNQLAPNQAPEVLFRRRFATSRFATLGAMVDQIRASRIRHKSLTSTLRTFAAGAVVTATDLDIQEALRAAGEQPMPAASMVSGICVYWAKRNNQSTFSPHAILIDAAEPLWRTRNEPVLETVPGQDDPAYQRVVNHAVDSMQIFEQGGPVIDKFVRSPSGTRTLAIISDAFTPPQGGASVQLIVHRPPSALYGILELKEALPSIVLSAVAPWEAGDA